MTDMSVSTVSTEVLEHECTELAAQIAAATCRFLLVVAELDRREAWGGWGCRSMAHWLSWRCSLSQPAAYEQVRVARSLSTLPVTSAAFERGELSYSKVRALSRVATAESEPDLVELARTATAAQLERIVRASIAATTDPAKRESMRELHLGVDDDGFGTTRVRVPIDQHAIVERAIAAALPLVEDSSAEEGLAQRRADALVLICESFLAHGAATRSAPARNNAVVHVDIDHDGVIGGETDAGVPVHPQACRRLLCDSTVQGMLGDVGLPIGAGRAARTINRTLRRAIKKRSGGSCEWIGCTSRQYVEAHHVWEWADGGPTELWNVVNVCWHHHHLVHEGGFRLVHDGAGGVTCYRPDGSEIRDPIPTMASVPIAFELADESIVPRWAGERFDLSACVDAVLCGPRGLEPRDLAHTGRSSLTD